MTDRQATRLIATLFIVTVGMIAWRHVKAEQGAPPPGVFTYPTALYSLFAVVSDIGAPAFAAVFAAAITVGVMFRLVELPAPGAKSVRSQGKNKITVPGIKRVPAKGGAAK